MAAVRDGDRRVVQRLLFVECPELSEEDEGGRNLRRWAGAVDALSVVCPWIDPVRPGVCVLPIRGPLRYFGDERTVLDRVAEVVGLPVRLGVAEGVFAASLAARAGVVVAAGATPAFLAPWPVSELGDRDLAELLVRLGLTTLEDFAALPTAEVLARFGSDGARRHRLARGEEGELPGYRVPGTAARLATALGRDLAPTERQPGFWGGASAADERAAEALTGLQRRIGSEAVTVVVLDGGRGPSDRFRLVPWHPDRMPAAETGPGDAEGEEPWPGRLPPPAPARVPLGEGAVVEVVDGAGAPVGVSGRGLLTGTPERVSVAGGPWTPVTGWSAPWPVEERWWTRARQRSTRLQVTTPSAAYLLLLERGRWRLEALYD